MYIIIFIRISAGFIPESDKKVKKLFIAPKARQILHKTAQRALARCECAQHTGFLMKLLNQESVLERQAGDDLISIKFTVFYKAKRMVKTRSHGILRLKRQVA